MIWIFSQTLTLLYSGIIVTVKLLLAQATCMRHLRWRLECIAGHCYCRSISWIYQSFIEKLKSGWKSEDVKERREIKSQRLQRSVPVDWIKTKFIFFGNILHVFIFSTCNKFVILFIQIFLIQFIGLTYDIIQEYIFYENGKSKPAPIFRGA